MELFSIRIQRTFQLVSTALPAAMYRIYKIPERFRQRKEPKEGKK